MPGTRADDRRPPGTTAAARRPASATWVAAGAAGALAVAGFLPWARSGSVSRSGYTLARTVRDTGLAEGALAKMLTAGVLVVPVLASAAWLAAALAQRVVVAAVVLAAGLLGAGAAGLVLRSDAVDARWGAVAGMACALLAVAGAATLWWQLLPRGDRR
jgi:hypothetical protein